MNNYFETTVSYVAECYLNIYQKKLYTHYIPSTEAVHPAVSILCAHPRPSFTHQPQNMQCG